MVMGRLKLEFKGINTAKTSEVKILERRVQRIEPKSLSFFSSWGIFQFVSSVDQEV